VHRPIGGMNPSTGPTRYLPRDLSGSSSWAAVRAGAGAGGSQQVAGPGPSNASLIGQVGSIMLPPGLPRPRAPHSASVASTMATVESQVPLVSSTGITD
jgi:hypothetical protein